MSFYLFHFLGMHRMCCGGGLYKFSSEASEYQYGIVRNWVRNGLGPEFLNLELDAVRDS